MCGQFLSIYVSPCLGSVRSIQLWKACTKREILCAVVGCASLLSCRFKLYYVVHSARGSAHVISWAHNQRFDFPHRARRQTQLTHSPPEMWFIILIISHSTAAISPFSRERFVILIHRPPRESMKCVSHHWSISHKRIMNGGNSFILQQNNKRFLHCSVYLFSTRLCKYWRWRINFQRPH